MFISTFSAMSPMIHTLDNALVPLSSRKKFSPALTACRIGYGIRLSELFYQSGGWRVSDGNRALDSRDA